MWAFKFQDRLEKREKMSLLSNATYINPFLFNYRGLPLQKSLQKAHLQALLPQVGA